MMTIVLATLASALVIASLPVVWRMTERRNARMFKARGWTDASGTYSPAWTGANGKRYKMHLATARVIEA